MIESIMFMALILIGSFFFIISIITLLIGILKKGKKSLSIGIITGLIPIICFGLIYYWYNVKIPSFNNSLKSEYAGKYVLDKHSIIEIKENGNSDTLYTLNLQNNGEYQCNNTYGLKLETKGTWETGGIDGVFNFYDNNGRQIEFAQPHNYDSMHKIEVDYLPEDGFSTNSSTVTFIKIK